MRIGIKLDNGEELEAIVGEHALHADGSALLRYNNTITLSAVITSKKPVYVGDFLPLTVEFREKSYAAGNIPGGFYKREGKPTEREILISRVIDRTIRPLFEEGFSEDTQAVVYALSADEEGDVEITAINSTSIALLISDIPFNIPVAAVRVGYKDGKFIINPKREDERKELDIIVSGVENGIVMVEGRADFFPDDKIVLALKVAHEHIKKIIEFEKRIVKAIGKSKKEFKPIKPIESVIEKIAGEVDMKDVLLKKSKIERDKSYRETLEKILKKVNEIEITGYEEDEKKAVIEKSFFELTRRTLRKWIIEEGKRVDGRGIDDIREIEIKIGVLPRAHGSVIFRRGETEALVTTTLGTHKDVQLVEVFGEIEETATKRFMFHYNFPGFSAGEFKPLKGPSRRDIGHGNLAEKALLPIIPPEEKFPYTIRVVSDILESNGSTSMASVCGGSLSLFDAGVPVSSHVAGIAMGLIIEGERYAILSDILGDEDHIGDMDFKIAGNEKGVSAVQMDLKNKGIPFDIIDKAIKKAREGRMKILDIMKGKISQPKELSKYAPKYKIVDISPDKIGNLIGPNGRNIKGIIKETGSEIDIKDDGKVIIFAKDEEKLKRTIELINYYTQDIEIGKIYRARVKKILEDGALIQIIPTNQFAFIHITQFGKRITKLSKEIKIGEEFDVKISKITEDGRIYATRKF